MKTMLVSCEDVIFIPSYSYMTFISNLICSIRTMFIVEYFQNALTKNFQHNQTKKMQWPTCQTVSLAFVSWKIIHQFSRSSFQ